MSETLWGVIIGGIIASLPSIVVALITRKNEKDRQKFELALKRFEVYHVRKRDILLDYIRALGVIMDSYHQTGAHDIYRGLYHQALALVPPQVRSDMEEAYRIVQSYWNGRGKSSESVSTAEALEMHAAISRVRSDIHSELSQELFTEKSDKQQRK